MSELGSAPLPDLADDDHVRGPDGTPLLIEYADLQCAYCAVLHARLADLVERGPLRVAFRYFPVRSSHPRAWAVACAAEAAGLQSRFWEMHDALFEDQGHVEDPHLWALAERFGLDVSRFDEDRRSKAVEERVQRDFKSGVRAGVVTTPTVFFDGVAYAGDALRQQLRRLSS